MTTYRGHIQNHASGRVRRLPHRPALRGDARRRRRVNRTLASLDARAQPAAAPRRSSTRSTRPAGSPRSTTRRSSLPQIPTFDDFCRGCSWGYSRGRDRLLAGRRDRGRDRAGGPPDGAVPGAEPVHAARDPLLGGRDRLGRGQLEQDRGRRLERLAPGDRRAAPIDPTSVTDAPIGMATTVVHAEELSEDGRPGGRRGGPHLRQAVGRRRARPAPRGDRPRIERPAGDHRRHHPRRRGRLRRHRDQPRRRDGGAAGRLRALGVPQRVAVPRGADLARTGRVRFRVREDGTRALPAPGRPQLTGARSRRSRARSGSAALAERKANPAAAVAGTDPTSFAAAMGRTA